MEKQKRNHPIITLSIAPELIDLITTVANMYNVSKSKAAASILRSAKIEDIMSYFTKEKENKK